MSYTVASAVPVLTLWSKFLVFRQLRDAAAGGKRAKAVLNRHTRFENGSWAVAKFDLGDLTAGHRAMTREGCS
jgi:hypothetical protein